MRDRLLRPQFVTVRRLVEQSGDVFGDAPIVASDNRQTGFRMKMQVTWTSGIAADPGDPGKAVAFSALATMRNRDVPAEVDWPEPKNNDIIELAIGRKLFVVDAQPAFPKRVSIGNPDGGWDGWRIRCTDRQPTASVADQYE